MFRIGIFALILGLCVPAQAQERAVPEARSQVALSFAPVVKTVSPAVVNVYSKKIVQAREAVSPLLNDPFFRQFFGDRLGLGAPRQRVQQSLGSGVILRADGVIVTNHHVIKDADAITVALADKREFEAKLIGSDERTDLAVLRIDARGAALPFVDLGDPDALQVGDLVLAIGNPFGVGQTVTSGIVSALARTSVGISDYQFFIQTDAAINPGNSGGALVAMDGKLMGINTAIYSGNGGSVGIGFAIPVTMVRSVVASVLKNGRAIRPWFGAVSQTVNAELARELGLARPGGAAVVRVHPGGPADKAGVKKGDVILSVNNRDVDDEESLRFRIATLAVGDSMTLRLASGGKERGATLALIAPPETPPTDAQDLNGRHPLSGVTVANLNPALIEDLGLHGDDAGVIVLRVLRGGFADRLGIEPGDVLLRINSAAVDTVADLKRALERGSGGWRIQLRRQGRTLNLQVGG